MTAARDWLAQYLKQRVPTNLGAALATLPRFQEKFGEIEALLYTNRVLIENAAARADRGEPVSSTEANLVKYVATGNAIRAVEIVWSLRATRASAARIHSKGTIATYCVAAFIRPKTTRS